MLRAKKPEPINKRLKMFMYGAAGNGKTTCACQFPNAYIIDAEKGTENYDKLINAAHSHVFQTTDIFEVIEEVKTLLTEKHEFRTLVIDPITPLFNDLLDKSERKVGSEFGRHYGEANKTMKRFANLIMALDMNVIVTAHEKKEYGANLTVVGKTFDGWKQLDYWFDLVVELRKNKGDGARKGTVVKTRLEAFPDGSTFDWSYEEIHKRCGDIITQKAKVVAMATPDQVAELKQLLTVIQLPEGTVEKWLSKAGVDTFDDMPAETIQKCIDFTKKRFPAATAA